MKKVALVSLIYLCTLALVISCSKKTVPPPSKKIKEYLQNVKISSPAQDCTGKLITELGYSPEKYTELVMQCNILTLQRLDVKVRKLKGPARIDIVILGVQCDNIARLLKEHEAECKNSLTVTGI